MFDDVITDRSYFQKLEKTNDDVIFPVLASVLVLKFVGLDTKFETGLGLGKMLWSWSRTCRSPVQPCRILLDIYRYSVFKFPLFRPGFWFRCLQIFWFMLKNAKLQNN